MSAVDIGGDEEEEHVLEALDRGIYHLWVVLMDDVPTAGVIMEVERRNGRGVVVCRYAGGEKIDLWSGELDRVTEAFAREHGCSAIEMDIRRGLEPTAMRLGYREAHRTWRRELAHG